METAWLQDGVAFFQTYGLWGLLAVAFLESFISPILPDLLLIPMALANPEQAIWYAVWTTLTSVLGGFIGYYGGHRFGLSDVPRPVYAGHFPAPRVFAQPCRAVFAVLERGRLRLRARHECVVYHAVRPLWRHAGGGGRRQVLY